MNIGGQPYPKESYETSYDHRNHNQTLDAFNINNSRTVSISDDLRTSLQPFVKYTNYDSADAVDPVTGATVGSRGYHWTTGDRGRFFIAIPHCDSGIFQGGLTRGSVTVTMEGGRMDSTKCPPKLAKIKYENPVLVTTSDRIMIIRNRKPDGLKQVEITTASFDELMS
jgi:hypothetical protein